MAAVELRTLGDCQIVVGDERLGPQSPYAFALALYLAVERGRPHTRDELVAIFFPGVPEGNAAHSLRQNLYKLRQLGVPAETTAAGTILPAAAVRADYSALLATSELPDPRAERLPGEFLPGYWPRISEEFTRWLEGQRDAVNGALRRAYVSRLLDRRAVGRWDEVERFARACLAIDPLNEEATLALAEALALSGSKAAGVRLLDAYLEEVGGDGRSLAIPATILRKRISERLPHGPHTSAKPRLIGREDEFRRLSHIIAEVHLNSAATVLITGEPGLGKSRLVQEFVASASLSGTRVIDITCQAYDLRRPGGTLGDLVPALLRLPGAVGCAPHSLGLVKRLYTTNPLEVGHLRIPANQVEADTLASQVAAALSDLIDAVTAESTLIMIIEDIHWLDRSSLQLLSDVATERKNRRLLLLLTAREFPAHFCASAGAPLQQLRLRPLAPEDVQSLVSSLLGEDAVSDDLLVRVKQLAGGNPFYVRALCDHFRNVGSAGSLPAGLLDLTAQRTRHLSTDARCVLLACALLGRYSTIDRISRSVGLPTHSLFAILRSCEAEGLLNSDCGDPRLSHALLSEYLLDTESQASMKVLRLAVAKVLILDAHTHQQEGLYWAAAIQFSAAGDEAAARDAVVWFGTAAASRGTLLSAITVLDLVSAALSLRGSAEDLASADLGDSLPTVGPLPSGGFAARNSAPIPATSARIRSIDLRRVLVGTSEHDVRWLRALLQDDGHQNSVRIEAAAVLIAIAEDLGNADLAHWTGDVALRLSSPTDVADASGLRLALSYEAVFGDARKALVIADQQWTSMQHDGLDEARLAPLVNCAVAFERCERLDQSLGCLQRVFALASAHQCRALERYAASQIAWTCRQMGRTDEARKWLAQASVRVGEGTDAPHGPNSYAAALMALDESPPSAAQLIRVLAANISIRRENTYSSLVTGLQIRYAATVNRSRLDAAEIGRLESWSLRTAALTPEDDVALSVYLGLGALGRRSDGERFRSRYLAARRNSPWILPRLLAE